MGVRVMSETKKVNMVGIIIFAFLLAISIVIAIWVYLIRTNNFINLGEQLRPYLKDIPVVSLILPPPLEEHNPLGYSREELEELFKKLSQENEQLAETKAKLEEENSSLKEVEEKYSILLTEVENLKKAVQTFDAATVEEVKAIEEKKHIADIVKVYEAMEPSDAASVLESMGTLNITLVVDICKTMKSSKFAEILQEMDKDFAAILSERMIKD